MSLLIAKLIAKELKVPIDDLYEWLEAEYIFYSPMPDFTT
jgi:hypothetical protein